MTGLKTWVSLQATFEGIPVLTMLVERAAFYAEAYSLSDPDT